MVAAEATVLRIEMTSGNPLGMSCPVKIRTEVILLVFFKILFIYLAVTKE